MVLESTTRVSIANDGTLANNSSTRAVISTDGRFVAFESSASNLVSGDTNNATDIFVRDLQNNTITRVSISNDGIQASGSSSNAAISADGRFVAFASGATNLVPGDTNSNTDIFVRDLQNNTTTRVSVTNNGIQATGGSSNPVISADGRFVAFESSASNLVPGDTNGSNDIFVRDLQNNTITRVSVANDGSQASGVSSSVSSTNPVISADGRFVAFVSSANNLVPGDTNNSSDIFVRDLQNGTTRRVSVASDGTEANSGSSGRPAISDDGRFVAFTSNASNLFPADINNTTDVRLPSSTTQIFLRDLETGITTQLSVADNGAAANNSAVNPAISADGRFVTFESSANNLVLRDTNNSSDIFVRDLLSGTITRTSLTNDSTQANASSSLPAISADGLFVAFQSTANNLVAGDTNNTSDIFVRTIALSTDVTDVGVTIGIGDTININGNDTLGLIDGDIPAILVGVDTSFLERSNFITI